MTIRAKKSLGQHFLKDEHIARQIVESIKATEIGKVLEILPFSRSGWFHGIKVGLYPPPIHISPRVAVWRNSDILRLARELGSRDKINGDEK